ncbi:GTPase-activating protein Gyp6p [Monosporozyma servazzii]
MSDLLQAVIHKYTNRDQLIQEGIWRGDIYGAVSGSTPKRLDRCTRGWIWRTLVLQSMEDTNNQTLNMKNVDLVPVPMVSVTSYSGTHLQENLPVKPVHEHGYHSRVNSLENPIRKLSQGIRKLTPKETYTHPLRQSNQHGSNTNRKDEHLGFDNLTENMEDMDDINDGMVLKDTLEIIDLDLSRLIIDDIFRDPRIHAEMRQIMFSYLVHLSLQRNPINSKSDLKDRKFYYKQGFHELLGMLFLQLYDPINNMASKSYMRNTLFIFERLMNQIEPTFYCEKSLIHWESTIFAQMLKVCAPKLYKLFYSKDSHGKLINKHSNMIWLIRWTRLLFMRELPRESVYIIWDHILTFTFPLKTLISSIIIMIILQLNDILLACNGGDDMDDLMEIMLHIKDQPNIINLNPVELCKVAGNLTEMWHLENYNDMKLMVDKYLNPIKRIDPHRKRMEDKLRLKVQQSLSR